MSDKQVKRLIDASHNLAAYFAADACRVIGECDGEENLVPFLNNLPVKVVREFDAAIYAITESKMDSFDDEAKQRLKYEKVMAEMKEENQ